MKLPLPKVLLMKLLKRKYSYYYFVVYIHKILEHQKYIKYTKQYLRFPYFRYAFWHL